MLDLRDFIHLPQLDRLLQQLAADGPGLVVVAGLDPRPQATGSGDPLAAVDGDAFVPSGRTALWGILARQLLSDPMARPAWIVAESKGAVRIPNALKGRVRVEEVRARPVSEAIASAVKHGARLIVLEPLTAESLPAALQAANLGARVLTQLDTVFYGRHVAQHLRALGASAEQLAFLTWVVTVQRIPTLCNNCRQPLTLDAARLADLHLRFPEIPLEGSFYAEGTCAVCQYTGRKGDIALFDIFHADAAQSRRLDGPSLLRLDEYALGLAAQGYLTVDDVIGLDAKQLRRSYRLLTASETALGATNARLTAKLAELEAANRVLQERTEALVSLQKVSHALITSDNLDSLASSLCQQARQLCCADRVALYLLHPDRRAEILAVSGWDAQYVHRQVEVSELFPEVAGGVVPVIEPAVFQGWPPGIPARAPDVEGVELRQGLRVPLVAQHQIVGLFVFHTSQRTPFSPGEVALLQAFADQAAVAVQRARLIADLQDKVERLEEAQVGLAKKERLERELELAREVQQSMLPQVFPVLPGYAFAARCEPARRIGGDFYDVFPLDGNRFGVIIADVSDKGMPAALFMGLARSLLLAEAQRETSPRPALLRVHDLLRKLSQSSMYLTLFYGVVERDTRRLTYVRAGHDRPVLIREGQMMSLPGEGTVIGLLETNQLHLDENELKFEPGDRLVLYTDGVIDALSPSNEPFGLDRLTQALSTASTLPLAAMCDEILETVTTHQGTAEQYDDITLLSVEVL